MKTVLLDTCAIIYLFADPNKISPATFTKIEKSACLLSISFAEIACKVSLGRLSLGKYNMPDLLSELSNTEHLQLLNITPQMWIDTVQLGWENHKDPVDRMLVSYAQKQDLELVTTDQKIKEIYPKCII